VVPREGTEEGGQFVFPFLFLGECLNYWGFCELYLTPYKVIL
jgi:hypothetical protein